MGLDMYAFAVDHGVDIKEAEDNAEQIAYWRKFNALHGWMQNLYEAQGGTEEFNCIPVLLSEEDIDRLEEDLKEERLEPIKGFFFGEQDIGEYDVKATREFIGNARQHMSDGKDVYYDSWW